MKKRGAAIAALTLGLFQALGVLGAVPASAAAPNVTEGQCTLTNNTLFAYGAESSAAQVPGEDDGGVILQMNGDNLECTFSTTDGNSTKVTVATAKITDVVVSVEGGVTFRLLDAGDLTAPYRAGDFPEADWAIAALSIGFNGEGVTDPRDEFDVIVSDDAFEMNGISGDVDYVDRYGMTGTENGDAFDASEATVDVNVDGSYGADTIAGGEGDDTITGGYGNDVLYGNDGEDELDCREATVDDDGVPATEDKSYPKEADQCWGGADDDLIEANAPDGGAYAGFDTVAPGDGDDDFDEAYALYYGDSSEAVEVSLDDQETMSDAGDDLWSGSVFAVIGSAKDDTLIGTDGDDVLSGGDGADTIMGYLGDDTLAGGGGDDTIGAGGGDDSVKGAGGADVVKAGSGNDTVNGGGGDDVLYGNRGSDKLLGKAGDDQTWGGPGKDLCIAETKDSCEYTKV